MKAGLAGRLVTLGVILMAASGMNADGEQNLQTPPRDEPETAAAFLAAVTSGELEDVNRLLADNAALADIRNEKGVSAVLLALYHGHVEVAESLANVRNQLDVFEAAALGRIERLRAILDESPDAIDLRSADEFTPLHLACFFDRPRATRILLAHGADVEAIAANPSGVRPIHSASGSRSEAIVRILMSAGADPNAQQEGGWTALHSAAKHGNAAMVTSLLSAGAQLDLAGGDGTTALDFARELDQNPAMYVLENWPTPRTE